MKFLLTNDINLLSSYWNILEKALLVDFLKIQAVKYQIFPNKINCRLIFGKTMNSFLRVIDIITLVGALFEQFCHQ